MSKTTSLPTHGTKFAILRKLLSLEACADMDALQSTSSWQHHYVRAELSVPEDAR